MQIVHTAIHNCNRGYGFMNSPNITPGFPQPDFSFPNKAPATPITPIRTYESQSQLDITQSLKIIPASNNAATHSHEVTNFFC